MPISPLSCPFSNSTVTACVHVQCHSFAYLLCSVNINVHLCSAVLHPVDSHELAGEIMDKWMWLGWVGRGWGGGVKVR